MRSIILLITSLLASQAAFAAAQRVISLAPHTTELAYAAGLGDSMIAASDYSDYPEAALELERVANYQGINLERIVTLNPDLILAWPVGNAQRELEKLEKLGFEIFYSSTGSLEKIAENLERLSHYADDPQIGLKAARDFRTQLAEIESNTHSKEPVSYFYQLSEKPMITLGGKSWPNEVFEFCGGKNIFAQSKAPYPQVNMEQIIVAKPQAIFTSEHAIAHHQWWLKWSNELPAVSKNHIWSLTSDWLNRPTPRTLLAIKEVCQHFDTIRESNLAKD
ncbi:vitamin B12 ABC transporter substrate-binding protein BtuF [Vibrio hippocampi]|uniref:Vitamin B12-binding protein n=1 Tax=Vibrio hippocampi TaxID=654686 RepID=A0ABM8ZJY0_9VIBR|nr:vitamin B12 ABC transporter substrate-binding protein BtuF [Vibrio hippocampi]CAH0527065.1 Vitamin B12-binding protein [Vibrio hippocampi]